MAAGKNQRMRVQVIADSAAERTVAEWMRGWRRRGVRRLGKTMYPWQGAEIAMDLSGPAAAFDELRARLRGHTSASVEPLVSEAPPAES